jgi:glycine/D-amino acid oxidase-like deaminating enzyme
VVNATASGSPSPDTIVVGGRQIGTSIAYHLARAGVRTLLIEQGDLTSGASGANFGNVQVEDAEFGLSLELTMRSYARFNRLQAELCALLRLWLPLRRVAGRVTGATRNPRLNEFSPSRTFQEA